MGIGFVFSMAASLPGHLSYDSVIQLLEGRTAIYSGWHPPVMSWLLGLGDWLLPGAALFVVAVALLFFASLLSLLWLIPRICWAAPVVAALCIVTPQVLLYQGIVWKDVLFADSAVAGFVALAHAAPHWNLPLRRYLLIAVAVLCFSVAALTRQNGLLLLPFGVFALGWIAWRSGAGARELWFLAGGFSVCVIGLTLAAGALLAERIAPDRGVFKEIRILEFYDLIGGLSLDPDLRVPELARRDPSLLALMRSDGRKVYSPVRSDTLVRSQRLQAALAQAPDDILHRPWLHFMLHNPVLYLRERSAVFRWVFLTPDISLCVPYVVGLRGPPQAMSELGLQTRVSTRDKLMDAYGEALMGTPLFSHLTFLSLALCEIAFLLLRRRGPDIALTSMLLGAIAFCASFFFISIACDYRYFYVLDLAALSTLFYLSLDPRPCALKASAMPALLPNRHRE
jgi:hypothetical protein